MSTTSMSRLGRQAAAGLIAVAVAIVAAAAPAAATVTATTIDTYQDWGGVTYLQDFGHPDTATYGQVITVPAGARKLKDFAFWMGASTHTSVGTITMRAEVYSWDGRKASKEIWESQPRELVVDPDGPLFEKVQFQVTKARLKPGKQYVLFASVSKDYEVTDPFVSAAWGANLTDVLPGGYAVFLNDTGDESQWTGQSWIPAYDYDFAMIANFK
jgi:hypothetical protein